MLKESIKALLKDSVFYGVSGSVSKFFLLITIPLLARILSPDQLGIYDVVTSIASAFVAFAVLGQDSAIVRFYYDSEDADYRRKVVSIGLFIQLALIVTSSLIIIIFGDYIGRMFFGNKPEYIRYWKLSLVVVPGQALLLFSQNLFKYNFIRLPYLLLSIGSTLVFAILIVILIWYSGYGIEGAILASVIAMNVFGIWGLWMNRKLLTINFQKSDARLLRSLLGYGLPFMGVMAISMLLPVIDRFFLLRYVSNSVLAEYAIATKVAYFLAIFVSSFSIASGPYIFSVWQKKEAPAVFSKLLHLYVAGTAFIALAIYVFRDIGITVMGGTKYLSAGKYLPLLLTSGMLEGLFIFSLVGILWAKKAVYNFYVFLIGLIIILILNYLLVPVYLVEGAIAGIVIARIIMNVAAFIISNKYYKINIEIFFMIKCLLLTLLLGVLSYFNFWLGILSLILFPVLFYQLLLAASEKQIILSFMKPLFRKKI